MEELTIQILKMGETLNKVLENQLEMKKDISKLNERLDKFEKEMHEFMDEMHKFKDEMYDFKDEMYEFKEKTTISIDKINFKMEDGFSTVVELFKMDDKGVRGFEKVKFS